MEKRKKNISKFTLSLSGYFDANNKDQKNLASLSIEDVHAVGNLKYLATALPFDPVAADDIRAEIGSRPTLLLQAPRPKKTWRLIFISL